MTETLSSTYAPLVEDRTGCLLNIGANYVNPGIYKTTHPGFFPVQTQEDASKYIDHSFTTRIDNIPMPTGERLHGLDNYHTRARDNL